MSYRHCSRMRPIVDEAKRKEKNKYVQVKMDGDAADLTTSNNVLLLVRHEMEVWGVKVSLEDMTLIGVQHGVREGKARKTVFVGMWLDEENEKYLRILKRSIGDTKQDTDQLWSDLASWDFRPLSEDLLRCDNCDKQESAENPLIEQNGKLYCLGACTLESKKEREVP